MRHIIWFIGGVTVIAWGGCFLGGNLAPENPARASIGVTVAALGPLFMAIVLRKRTGQGWKNAGLKMRFRENKGWYALSLLYTPLVVTAIAGLAFVFGVVQWNPDRGTGVSSIFTTLGIVLGPMLLAAVGEEFGWRGFLEPELWALNQRVVLNHIAVGVVWGVWHFPILLFAPDSEANLAQLTMVVVGCVALAILYGQMRLWSDSVWPCVILHGVSNTVMISVAGSELLMFDEGLKDVISLNTTSLAVTGLWLLSAAVVVALLGKKSAAQIARTAS